MELAADHIAFHVANVLTPHFEVAIVAWLVSSAVVTGLGLAYYFRRSPRAT